MYLRALRIKEKIFGKQNIEVAMTSNNLAVLYKSQGKYREAERLYRRALSIFEKRLAPKHPNLIACRDNYNSLVKEMNRRPARP
jgi:hypothetical protein